jgi:membrane-bound lytic murein transglycosylase D
MKESQIDLKVINCEIEMLRKQLRWLKWISLGIPSMMVVFILFFSGKQNTQSDVLVSEKQTSLLVDYTIPDHLTLFGEVFPIQNGLVKERLDHEIIITLYRHSVTLLGLKRSERLRPIIDSILAIERIPLDFFYLAVAESNLGSVISPAGAAGIWQFMPETAQGYGLKVNSEIDERYHLVKSTHAACKYLKEAFGQFNSWLSAAASYNMGMKGLKNKMDIQKSRDYFSLKLNQETARYVFRIMAIKLIWESPEKFGYISEATRGYPEIPTRSVWIEGSLNLVDFAREHKVAFVDLIYFNPWLRGYELNLTKGQGYEILVPVL